MGSSTEAAAGAAVSEEKAAAAAFNSDSSLATLPIVSVSEATMKKPASAHTMSQKLGSSSSDGVALPATSILAAEGCCLANVARFFRHSVMKVRIALDSSFISSAVIRLPPDSLT